MAEATIEAQPRTALGKKVNALRRAGITPIHVYGHGGESLSLQANTYDLVRTILDVGFTSPITIKDGSNDHFVMINKVQRHPVSELLLHVDLIRVSRTERIHANIPLHFEGEAMGARDEGSQLYEDLHSVEVEALPMDLPNSFTVDISVMTTPDIIIQAKDLALPPNVALVTDPEATIVRIVHRTMEVEEGAEAAEAEEAAGEEEASSEAGEESKAEESTEE